MSNVTFGGINPKTNTEFAYYETIAGGMGGRLGKKGINAIQTHMTNTLNTPIEALERELPIIIKSYSIRQSSGGTGKYKGGNGIVREFKFLTNTEVTIITERRLNAPYGINGGNPGTKGINFLITEKGKELLPPKKTFKVKPGNILRIETPGGGGWGKANGERV
jgi:N-methylhydantoinase B